MPTRDGSDLLDDLTRAGVHVVVVHGDQLRWRCDPARPPVNGALFEELKGCKAAVIAILLDIPAGCPVPHICTQLGVCPREIAESACTDAGARLATVESEAA